MRISDLRNEYHKRLCSTVVRINHLNNLEYPNFCDVSSRASICIGTNILKIMGFEISHEREKEQTVGDKFEEITKEFIEKSFLELTHLRPGNWFSSTKSTDISRFSQYEHLAVIDKKVKEDKDLSTLLGLDYMVKPDIIIARNPVSDEEINENELLISNDENISRFTALRRSNLDDQTIKILHASISCKWTIRSDRSQNTRTEALNLIRNRKGHLPHIVAVTAEPLPTRIATLALGTGDLDCVYHFALNELSQAIQEINNEDQKDMLNIMISGRRLKDISDLPFDLAI